MQFVTKFLVGDTVYRQTWKGELDPRFVIGQIRITTLKDGTGCLIQYRTNYSTGRNGPWYEERLLRKAL